MMIHFICFNKDFDFNKSNIELWQRYNPGLIPRIWTENDIISELTSKDPGLLNLYTSFTDWITRFDLAKYILLYLYGGIYSDIDIVPLCSIKDLLTSDYDLIACECNPSAQTLYHKLFYGILPWQIVIDTKVIISPVKESKFFSFLFDEVQDRLTTLVPNDPTTIGLDYLEHIGPMAFTKWVHKYICKNRINILEFSRYQSYFSPIVNTKTCNPYTGTSLLRSFDWHYDTHMSLSVEKIYSCVLIVLLIFISVLTLLAFLLVYNKRATLTLVLCLPGIALSIACSIPGMIREYYRFTQKKYIDVGYSNGSSYGPIYNPRQFTYLDSLQESWYFIRNEAVAAWEQAPIINNMHRNCGDWTGANDYFNKISNRYGWIKAWNLDVNGNLMKEPNEFWLNYGIMYKGQPFEENIKLCPLLYSLLSPIKDRINVCGFSWMKATTKLHKHTDSTGIPYGSLSYHLGLIVPTTILNTCQLVVHNKVICEQPGKVIVFDSSYPHYAENNSTEDRIILYIDFLNYDIK